MLRGMAPGTLFYIQQSAPSLRRLETALTAARRRCNLMHVRSAEQAAAILRRDADRRAPDLVIIWGAATDPRAAELARMIREDPALLEARFVVAADAREASDAEALLRSPTEPFPEDDVAALIDRDTEFWWCVVRFSA